MELFSPDPLANLLPCDGVVHYHGPVLAADDEGRFFEALMAKVPWRHDEAVMFGRRIVTARKVAWFGDSGYDYTYSGTTRRALPWIAELRELKETVESRSGSRFNSCLLNLYHHGGEGMAWHSDDEKSLARHSPIASLSLGAERKFRFKHRHRPELAVSVLLEAGSLLVMGGSTQTHWLHCVPKSKRVTGARINLTFRTMAV